MKTVKKGLALLLALIMVLSLTACGNLEALKTVRKIQKLESYHADYSIDMNMSLGMLGQSFMDMPFRIDGDADVNRDPLCGEGTFQADLMGETKEGRFYLAKEDNTLTLYLSTDGGETWKANPIDLSDSSPDTGFGFSREFIESLVKIADSFEEAGEEEVNGYTATVYEGFISGEEMKAKIDESDALDAVAEGMELDPDELVLEEIGDIPITVALDNETGLPVKFTVDLSALMDSLLPLFIQAVTKASAESGEDTDEIIALLSFMDVSFDEFLITVLLSDFDEVGEVTIPEEVIAAAVETGSPVSAGG
ncbi:MAG: hypothetical protein J6U19_08015 [Oscillospiraceae bacterium]|nr:hypothetical protein [Oscillospiraceae bacterium]